MGDWVGVNRQEHVHIAQGGTSILVYIRHQLLTSGVVHRHCDCRVHRPNPRASVNREDVEMEIKFSEEMIMFSTVQITMHEDGGGLSTGTGFLVQAPVPQKPGHGVICLVTARHVLREGSGKISCKLHCCDPADPTNVNLKASITIEPSVHGNTFYGHDDPDVDVAALNMSLLRAQAPDIFWLPLTPDSFANFETDLMAPTMQIMFVGYPAGLHDERNNLPIVRMGHIATLPRVDFDDRPVFLIDAEVFGGSSGSPVLGKIGGGWKLMGLVVEGYNLKAKVERAAKKQHLVARQHLGIGVVFKVKAISEVLEKVIHSQK